MKIFLLTRRSIFFFKIALSWPLIKKKGFNFILIKKKVLILFY